jgi:hypothetical protein
VPGAFRAFLPSSGSKTVPKGLRLMRIQFLPLFLIATLSFAWDMPHFFNGATYEPSEPELKKFTSIVKKDGRCSFAVVLRARPNAPKVIRGLIENQIHSFGCVGDIIFGENTLQEKSGCTVFALDGNTLSTDPINQYVGYQMVEGKKCSVGGFEELMTRKGVGGSVGQFLIGNADFQTERVVIYSDNPKYIQWFRSEKTKSEAVVKTQLQKYRKENGAYPQYYSGYQDKQGTPYKEVVSGDPLLR